MRFASLASRAGLAALSATALLATGLGGTASATDCNSDIAALSQKRQVFMEKLNVLAKAAKGKLDPVASCPTLKGLVATEANLLKYLESNKNWCNVPDNTVDGLKAANAKSQQFASQACTLAVQVKKQQQEAASGSGANALGIEAQKLPTGPL